MLIKQNVIVFYSRKQQKQIKERKKISICKKCVNEHIKLKNPPTTGQQQPPNEISILSVVAIYPLSFCCLLARVYVSFYLYLFPESINLKICYNLLNDFSKNNCKKHLPSNYLRVHKNAYNLMFHNIYFTAARDYTKIIF